MKRRGHAQGLKPRLYCGIERPKAEALGCPEVKNLEAKARFIR
jgi:hypothetical protein